MGEGLQVVFTTLAVASAAAWLVGHWFRSRKARACSACEPRPRERPPERGIRSRALGIIQER